MIILHGDNIVASRNALYELRRKYPKHEVIQLDGKSLTSTDLIQSLEAKSLFGQEKLVVVENLFGGPASRRKDELLSYIKKSVPTNIIIWEKVKIDGRRLIPFLEADIREFKLTSFLFRFLDSFWPKNTLYSLRLLRETLVADPPEIVFWMLGVRIALLIIASDLGERGLPSRLAPWQKQKILLQAKKFSLGELLKIYKKLLITDYLQKTGQSAFSLTSSLELLVANL
jgi:DNA polymerase III delta subunit